MDEKCNEYEVSKNNFINSQVIYGKDIDNSEYRPIDNLQQLRYVQFNNI